MNPKDLEAKFGVPGHLARKPLAAKFYAEPLFADGLIVVETRSVVKKKQGMAIGVPSSPTERDASSYKRMKIHPSKVGWGGRRRLSGGNSLSSRAALETVGVLRLRGVFALMHEDAALLRMTFLQEI